MSEIYKDFLYMDDNALDKNLCKEIVKYTSDHGVLNNNSFSTNQNQSLSERTYFKDDTSFVIHTFMLIEDYWKNVYEIINDGYNKYLSKWSGVVKEREQAYCPIMKYHVVHQYQGYHAWHYEWMGNQYPSNDIVLAWHISLTSHKNEGELEFKYYDKRIEPEAGRLLIWPAGFTHTHRGNCIRSDTQKHYMTGWWFVDNKKVEAK